jgi:hypothetical protein
MARRPCKGGGTCCDRPRFDRSLFPCDEKQYLRTQLQKAQEEARAARAGLRLLLAHHQSVLWYEVFPSDVDGYIREAQELGVH